MDEWIRLVTYPILDELIIPNSQLGVKNFFQDEWIIFHICYSLNYNQLPC